MLLEELRRRYASLLYRVPRQVVGLHRELLTQRAMGQHACETFQAFKHATGGLLSEMKHIIEEIQMIRLGAMQLRNTPGNCQLYFNSSQTEIEAEIMKLEEDTNTWERESNTISIPDKMEYFMSSNILDSQDNTDDSMKNDEYQKPDERKVCIEGLGNKSIGLQSSEEDSGCVALQLALSRLKRAEERAADAEEKVCELQLRLNLLDNTGHSEDVKT